MDSVNDRVRPAKKLSVQKEVDEKSADFRYDTRDYTLEYIHDKMETGVIFAPDYQRSYVWTKEKRYYFIESLFLRLPIPIIFLASREEKRGHFEIVDGYQRMSTVKEFIDGKLVLKGLEKIPSLNGFSFNDLLPTMQEEFKNITLRTVTLYSNHNRELIRDLFKRINTTNEKLKEYEIIYGTCKNNFITMIDELEKDEDFGKATPLSSDRLAKDSRERAYLLLRFFVFLDHYKEIRGKQQEFLRHFAEFEAPKLRQEQLEEYRKIFRDTINFVKSNFGEYGFGKSDNKTPRYRFDVLSVGLALALRQKPDLIMSNENISCFLNSDQFKNSIPKGASANSRSFVEGIENVRDFFLGKKTK